MPAATRRTEDPPLMEAETPGHLYRCWFPVDSDEGRDALARNIAAGVPSAVQLTETPVVDPAIVATASN